jgi:hypothetical protein
MSQASIVDVSREMDRRQPGRRAMLRRGHVTGTSIHVRLQPELLAKVDEVRAGTTWSRPEAVRVILAEAFEKAGLRG